MMIPGITNGLTAQRAFNRNAAGLANTIEKLSTGSRINRAADDPAGLITSENLRSVLAWLDAETRSMQRTDHVIATADSALGEVSSQIRRAESLEIANANGAGISAQERAANQMEIDSIHDSINRQLGGATFNGRRLFDGSLELKAGGSSLTMAAISLTSTGGSSADRLQSLQDFRSLINTTRGELGAFSKNIIQSQRNNTAVTIENLSAAESIIRDTDFARESAEVARYQLMTQAAGKALVLTNLQAGNVLSLLA